jgi:hypothetical protein
MFIYRPGFPEVEDASEHSCDSIDAPAHEKWNCSSDQKKRKKRNCDNPLSPTRVEIYIKQPVTNHVKRVKRQVLALDRPETLLYPATTSTASLNPMKN